MGGEPTVVHVTVPKGEDTCLVLPEGRDPWTFTWPDQVVKQLPSAADDMAAVELFGPCTVVIVRGNVQGCDGFLGDIKGYGEA